MSILQVFFVFFYKPDALSPHTTHGSNFVSKAGFCTIFSLICICSSLNLSSLCVCCSSWKTYIQ